MDDGVPLPERSSLCPSSTEAGWTCVSTHSSISTRALRIPRAFPVEVPRDRLDVLGELGPQRFEATNFLAQVAFGVLSDGTGLLLGIRQNAARSLFGLRQCRTRLSFGFCLRLVHELLRQHERPLQRVVGDRLHRLLLDGGRLLPSLGEKLFELCYALRRLVSALVGPPKLLLKGFSLDRNPLEVLIDIVYVVATQGLPELDRSETVEAGLLARLGGVHGLEILATARGMQEDGQPGAPSARAAAFDITAVPPAG